MASEATEVMSSVDTDRIHVFYAIHQHRIFEATESMFSVAAKDNSSLATEDMSSATTEDMSFAATQNPKCY